MHFSGELSPSFITPAVSPALLMWMRGSRGWYALQTSDVPLIRRLEMRRWKIAAPLVVLYFAGVAIAGTMPSRIESGPASVTIKTQESHDYRRAQFMGAAVRAMSVAAAQENARIHASYYLLYDDKRRQASGGLLSIGSASAAVVGTGSSYESHDRKRRQFTPPLFEVPRPATVVEEQIASRTGSASPRHRLHAQAPRRTVDYPHASSERDHVSYSSGSSVSDISTSSISKLPPIEPAEVITRESEGAERHASIHSPVIPKPSRKPPKPIKSVKALTAKVTPKKVTVRCRNRIWRC
jgi:hypothetical protein